MFIDEKYNQNNSNQGLNQSDDHYDGGKKYLYIGFVIFCFLLLIIVVSVYYVILLKKKDTGNTADSNQQNVSQTASSTGYTGNLPGDLGGNNKDGNEDDFSLTDIKAEDLTFGFFYEPETENFQPSIKNYSLPLNIKTDVSNYYDVSRKIALDSYLNDINKYGFAIIKNDKPKEITDFFEAQRYLASQEVPIVLTNDFILFYYQNNLKQIYKEIEKTTFFDNIWDVSNRMYQAAIVRYKKRKEQVGLNNDPLLEAERRECAYFATALRLMSPTKDQLNSSEKAKNENLFNEEDAQKYYFELPDFLQDDVSKEIGLIRGAAKGSVKSPLLLYDRDYQSFSVPQEYSYNAKLKNYYLALKWFNSLFPLYYRSDACPTCSLDYDDWRINVITANLIAEDLANNQDLKNKWAIVYKFIAFFSGLRQDLIYLNYRQVFNELYGEGKRVEEIFVEKRTDNEYQQWQTKLANYNFSAMEGGVDRANVNRPNVGLRLLQERYWPNDYIFGKLVGKNMTPKKSGSQDNKVTLCKGGWRCSGFSYDIVNLIADNPLEIKNTYFLGNTNYNNYDASLNNLKDEIGKFNVNSWNNNIFWITLELGRDIIGYNRQNFPIYAQSDYWQEKKNINTVLGAWTEINLPNENIYDYFEKENKQLGSYPQCNTLNYIEPNVELVNEIIAKNKMLIKMLNALNITKKNNIASVELINLNNKFARILEISKKELSGEEINSEDCDFINDFTIRYAAKGESRSFVLGDGSKKITESIEGVRYLGVVYYKGDKLVLGIGPIFNFNEYYSNK